MQMMHRQHGEEAPYWPAGPFKVRLPFIHYRWEMAEMFQALIMFVVSLAMIPLLEHYLGLPYEVALAYVVIGNALTLLPALLGVPLVPGWITPAVPLVLAFLGDFEPGPEAIQAMFALNFMVFLIFLLMGLTGLGARLVRLVPKSLQAGIILGAGLAAFIGEIQEGGRLASTPISLTAGVLVALFLMFSVAFRRWAQHHSLARRIANYGLVPSMVIAILVAWSIGEYPLPTIEWGITRPNFAELWNYLPFVVGFPSLDVFLLAIPTALIAYIIAFGDIVVGDALIAQADETRSDEKIDCDTSRVHHVTAIRNAFHAFFCPAPGLAGPIWTALTATVAERYKFGRHSMDSIFGGAGTFMITMFLATFILPLVSLFQPVLPIALSMTLILTGYVCLMIGMEQATTPAQRGVAGTTAIVLAIYGAGWGIIVGLTLYYLVEKRSLLGRETVAADDSVASEAAASKTVPAQDA
ncbi:xanthine/uracil/vitamin C permease [Halomonas campisalis]|uniref:Xanthine/uracil/vitamin C permease n=1 Tax=Billgrantia campisalis TaxID=74661 RepID=A0ABS9P5B9_9GAMM|nr:solute carrier family 23 protein [Halomonas campisalis]MCG6656973.1 xanthine/uracil/vitamin C permease [Halomonas campisalis]MDR5862161.1 solute carrier family 23 protein [Halomonas campisalis]